MQIANWVKTHVEQRTVATTGRSTGGLHFAGVENASSSSDCYEDVLRASFTALHEARTTLIELDAESENWPLVNIPLGEFREEVTVWDDAMWQLAGIGSESPALILMPRPLQLDPMAECYYRPVRHKTIPNDVCVLYTSYRSPELLLSGINEYYNSVYMFYPNGRARRP